MDSPTVHFLLIGLLLLCSGCYTSVGVSEHPAPIPVEESVAEVKTIRINSSGFVKTVAPIPPTSSGSTYSSNVGETIFSRIEINERRTIELDKEIVTKQLVRRPDTLTNYFPGRYVLAFLSKAGRLYVPERLVETDGTMSPYGLHGLVVTGQVYEPELAGVFDSGFPYGEARYFLYQDGESVSNSHVLDEIELSTGENMPFGSRNTFRWDLIYTGRSGSTITFTYREYNVSEDESALIRDSFSQMLSYEIAEETEIGFRGARIAIDEASNTGIRYRIISFIDR